MDRDFRKRDYDSYFTTHVRYFHSFSHEEYERYRKVFRRRFSRFLPEDKDSKIIDLGCGGGHLLYFLQREGYHQACGIDWSDEMVDVARRRGVERVELGDLFEVLAAHPAEFDFVGANHVIEHLRKDEVLNFLDLVRGALRPGGGVLMATPNAASLLGSRGAFIDFTHETSFTPESLAQVFRRCGFDEVAVYGEGPEAYDPVRPLRRAFWYVTKALLKAYMLIEGSVGLGGLREGIVLEPSIFVVGRRPDG